MNSINLHSVNHIEISKVDHNVESRKFQVVTIRCFDKDNKPTEINVFGNGSNEIKIKEIKE